MTELDLMQAAIQRAITQLDYLYKDPDLDKLLKGDVLQIKLILKEAVE